jgi:hypothetical protein
MLTAGAVALAFAVVPLPAGRSVASAPPGIEALPDAELDHSTSSKPLRVRLPDGQPGSVSNDSTGANQQQTPASPAERAPAPVEALPVTRLEPLAGSRQASASASSQSRSQRLQVALVASAPDQNELAGQTAALLRSDG